MTHIPTAALDQHILVLGKTGAGKSSVMRLLVEGLLDDGKPVCAVDPKGDWHGLRSSADGKRAGYPVVIFGGDHADVPINAHAGGNVAELVGSGNRPCLIDLGGWTVSDRTRFFIDFASTLFRTTRGRRWLVIDEVHNFAPQGKVYDPDAGKMLHWANRLASEGRGKGIQILAASQRPQKCHKDFVTSCETLIAMRVIHPLDRAAIKDWIDGCPDPDKGREVLGSLASMPRGTGWAWSPEIGFGPKRIQFPMFSTYDSFKAPTGDSQGKPLKGWADVDLDEVKAKLSKVVEQAKANDPAELRRQLVDARRALAEATKNHGKTEVKVERVEAPALKEADIKRLEKAAAAVGEAASGLAAIAGAISGTLAAFHAVRQRAPAAAAVQRRDYVAPAPLVRHKTAAPAVINGTETRLSGPEQRILDALAWLENIGVTEPEQTATAFLAGYTIGGGAWNNPRGALRTKGLIEYRGDRLALTDEGRLLAKLPDRLLTTEELHRCVLQRLPTPEQKLLTVLLREYPKTIENDDLARAAGYEPGGGAFNNPRGRLRSLGLIERTQGGQVRARDILFLK